MHTLQYLMSRPHLAPPTPCLFHVTSCSPVLVSRHALLVHGPRQLLGVWEDVVVVQDDRFHHLVDVRLTGHLVQCVGRGQEGGAEHNGQVAGVHHVLVAVLGEAAGWRGGRRDRAVITLGPVNILSPCALGVSNTHRKIQIKTLSALKTEQPAL